MEKEIQQRSGHTLMQSPQDDTLQDRKSASEQGITQALQVFDQLKPHIIWVITVASAIYNYFHPADFITLVGFLILMGVATGDISWSQAIEILLRKLIPLLSEKEGANDQPREKATESPSKPA